MCILNNFQCEQTLLSTTKSMWDSHLDSYLFNVHKMLLDVHLNWEAKCDYSFWFFNCMWFSAAGCLQRPLLHKFLLQHEENPWEVFTWPISCQMWTTHPTLATDAILHLLWQQEWKAGVSWALKHQGKTWLSVKESEWKITLFHSCFIYSRWKKSKGRARRFLFLQDEWGAEIPH